MVFSKCWRSSTALIISTVITSALPISTLGLSAAVAATQLETTVTESVNTVTLARVIDTDTQIPVALEEAERIIVAPGETEAVTLTVTEHIRAEDNTILIPRGSQIEGVLEPVEQGVQFVAREVVIATSNERLPIFASSQVVSQTETISRKSDPELLEGAAIGAAGGALIGEIFGSIDVLEVLGGAGAGLIASLLLRGNEEVEVFVIEPENDLTLTLEDDFTR
ncbi:MAG: hypothetical protein AAFV72_13930 [Cyanobacteria bacterium J06635_1]